MVIFNSKENGDGDAAIETDGEGTTTTVMKPPPTKKKLLGWFVPTKSWMG